MSTLQQQRDFRAATTHLICAVVCSRL